MEKEILKVKGMTCNHCKSTVQQALENQEGVKKPDVNLKKGTVKLTFDPSKIEISAIKKVIEEQGYEVL